MARSAKDLDNKDNFYESLFKNQIHDFIDKHKVEHQPGDDLNIFKMAHQLENRYAYILKTAKDRSSDSIKKVRKYNSELRDMIINERKKKIENRVSDLKKDIEKSLEEHNKIEKEEEEKMNKIYSEKKEELINKVLEELKLEFL